MAALTTGATPHATMPPTAAAPEVHAGTVPAGGPQFSLLRSLGVAAVAVLEHERSGSTSPLTSRKVAADADGASGRPKGLGPAAGAVEAVRGSCRGAEPHAQVDREAELRAPRFTPFAAPNLFAAVARPIRWSKGESAHGGGWSTRPRGSSAESAGAAHVRGGLGGPGTRGGGASDGRRAGSAWHSEARMGSRSPLRRSRRRRRPRVDTDSDSSYSGDSGSEYDRDGFSRRRQRQSRAASAKAYAAWQNAARSLAAGDQATGAAAGAAGLAATAGHTGKSSAGHSRRSAPRRKRSRSDSGAALMGRPRAGSDVSTSSIASEPGPRIVVPGRPRGGSSSRDDVGTWSPPAAAANGGSKRTRAVGAAGMEATACMLCGLPGRDADPLVNINGAIMHQVRCASLHPGPPRGRKRCKFPECDAYCVGGRLRDDGRAAKELCTLHVRAYNASPLVEIMGAALPSIYCRDCWQKERRATVATWGYEKGGDSRFARSINATACAHHKRPDMLRRKGT